jgi:ectoine hydroxylase-related dioxygenase (phytanoyl-CoA dioxygenase family)
MQSKKVNLFHEHVLIKEPGTSKKTPWHQDQPYYCVNGKDNCSFWIPLDPVSKSICPEFILYSHKWNKKFLPTKFFGEPYKQQDDEFENIPLIDNNRDDYSIVSWSLEPGDIIAFNFATVHGAPGNNTNNRRRAFSARFTGDDATFAERKGEISPPFPEVTLKHGDKMDCPSFPEIKFN